MDDSEAHAGRLSSRRHGKHTPRSSPRTPRTPRSHRIPPLTWNETLSRVKWGLLVWIPIFTLSLLQYEEPYPTKSGPSIGSTSSSKDRNNSSKHERKMVTEPHVRGMHQKIKWGNQSNVFPIGETVLFSDHFSWESLSSALSTWKALFRSSSHSTNLSTPAEVAPTWTSRPLLISYFLAFWVAVMFFHEGFMPDTARELYYVVAFLLGWALGGDLPHAIPYFKLRLLCYLFLGIACGNLRYNWYLPRERLYTPLTHTYLRASPSELGALSPHEGLLSAPGEESSATVLWTSERLAQPPSSSQPNNKNKTNIAVSHPHWLNPPYGTQSLT